MTPSEPWSGFKIIELQRCDSLQYQIDCPYGVNVHSVSNASSQVQVGLIESLAESCATSVQQTITEPDFDYHDK
jgi:hypothetical protein